MLGQLGQFGHNARCGGIPENGDGLAPTSGEQIACRSASNTASPRAAHPKPRHQLVQFSIVRCSLRVAREIVRIHEIEQPGLPERFVPGVEDGEGLGPVFGLQAGLFTGGLVFAIVRARTTEQDETRFHDVAWIVLPSGDNALARCGRVSVKFCRVVTSSVSDRRFTDSFTASGLSDWRNLLLPSSEVGSRGRTRTYNPTVNSRVLYH